MGTPGQTDLRLPPVDNLRLIKIDVEGMETNIIRGAQRAIAHFKPIIWSENTDYFEKNDMTFVALLDELEYGCAKAPGTPQDLICTAGMGWASGLICVSGAAVAVGWRISSTPARRL